MKLSMCEPYFHKLSWAITYDLANKITDKFYRDLPRDEVYYLSSWDDNNELDVCEREVLLVNCQVVDGRSYVQFCCPTDPSVRLWTNLPQDKKPE